MKRWAWILWVGTAAAMQSAEHGNMGPFGSWVKSAMFDDREQCVAGRNKMVADYLKANPTAVARKADLVADKKPLQGDETTIVHSVTRYACLPDTAKEPSFGDPGAVGVPGNEADAGGNAAPKSP